MMAQLRHRLLTSLILVTLTGCSRSHYRTDADAEVYSIVAEKESGTLWEIPAGFEVLPPPESRLYDPSDPDCPDLPTAEPRLYDYVLPIDQPVNPAPPEEPPVVILDPEPLLPSGLQMPGVGSGEMSMKLQALPKISWTTIPESCLLRMFEFESVRDEYRRTFEMSPEKNQRDQSPRLTLENIVFISQLNNRNYQSHKEDLYRSALALTLERFDYMLKFSSSSNRTALNYDHARRGGTTVNSLGIPTRFQVDKMLRTGGTMLARFANDVVLTFNGPDGFASDVSSELFFNLTQSILQRDVRFEPLIQSERNVVYTARNYTRFRREFFFDIASAYYELLLNYRQIEIEAQNYFSLVRELVQAEEEEATGIQRAPSRIQVEQIEQSMLQGQSGLISRCNTLENALDRLKLLMGVPTETAINLDLDELYRLTLGDESEVTGERVTRALKRAGVQRNATPEDLKSPIERIRLRSIQSVQTGVVAASLVLAERLVDWLAMRESLGEEVSEAKPIRILASRLQITQSMLTVDLLRQELTEARNNPASPALLLFRRAMDLSDGLHGLIETHLQAAQLDQPNEDDLKQVSTELIDIRERFTTLLDQLQRILESGELEKLDALPQAADKLLADTESIVNRTTVLAGVETDRRSPEEELSATFAVVDQLTTQVDEELQGAREGLVPVNIAPDDAMLTALTNRFELMNRRGFVADSRRDLKYRADDLRSVLNLNVSQTIGTQRNRPFDFTFDESRTSLDLQFDLPLNRQAQRNNYRASVIDYQRALRNLMELEDNIKFEVRSDLRDLALRRVQYQISVASAALAYERVTSTRIELNLGLGNVAARDFLEAQDDYRRALSSVATNHISYLINRTQFFLDLELLQVDETGFWPQLNEEDQQPQPAYDFDPLSGQPYGDLPQCLHMTPELRGTIVPTRY